jgi:hypothetical protein
MTKEWNPAIGERFIWNNTATLVCTKRVRHPDTGKRCLRGANITGSGYLDDERLDFEQCRRYWEPEPGDRVRVAVNWLGDRSGKVATVLGWIVDRDGLRLARLGFDDGDRRDCQHIWLEPIGGDLC